MSSRSKPSNSSFGSVRRLSTTPDVRQNPTTKTGQSEDTRVLLNPTSNHRELAGAASDPKYRAEHFRDIDGNSYVQVPVDRTLYIGAKDAETMIRLQDKTTDRCNDDSIDQLHSDKCQTRIEVALDRTELSAMGAQFPSELGDVKFSRLVTDVFKGVVPTVAADLDGKPAANELNVFSIAGFMGLDRYQGATREEERRTWVSKDGQRKPSSLSARERWNVWKEFNRRATKPLQYLEKQWKAHDSFLLIQG